MIPPPLDFTQGEEESVKKVMSTYLVSEDLDELLVLADRILVMSNGQIVYETPIQTADVATIGYHMAAQ